MLKIATVYFIRKFFKYFLYGMYFWKYNLVIFNKISELEDDLLVNWRIKILSGFKINLMF